MTSERIAVAVLGATGSVGQRFVQLLENHPWFELTDVVASERSAGKSYREAAEWRLDTRLPKSTGDLTVKPLGAELTAKLLFSGLDSSVAAERKMTTRIAAASSFRIRAIRRWTPTS